MAQRVRGANQFATACVEALGINPNEVRRIIIDMNASSAMVVYVEMYGTDRFYNITPVIPESAKIEILTKEAENGNTETR